PVGRRPGGRHHPGARPARRRRGCGDAIEIEEHAVRRLGASRRSGGDDRRGTGGLPERPRRPEIPMKDFEQLGVFYLGREFDTRTKRPTDDLVLYDSKDLVTHALCVGMTGSGKTGLGITLIEEAALDGVPA